MRAHAATKALNSGRVGAAEMQTFATAALLRGLLQGLRGPLLMPLRSDRNWGASTNKDTRNVAVAAAAAAAPTTAAADGTAEAFPA